MVLGDLGPAFLRDACLQGPTVVVFVLLAAQGHSLVHEVLGMSFQMYE